jgi:hypothetical protein
MESYDCVIPLDKVRVLLVLCSPSDEERLRVDIEHRSVMKAINGARDGSRVALTPLPAATIDDLRRALLKSDFEIIHFSGHGDSDFLVFETADGGSSPAPLTAIAELIGRYASVKCVILNACNAVKLLRAPISPITVGMDNRIDDAAALEFAEGFYDALGEGRSLDFTVEEGVSAVKLAGLDANPIKVLNVTNV